MNISRMKFPSERDQEIYYAVMSRNELQKDVAARFKITKGRVSQIIRRVQEVLCNYVVLNEGSAAEQMFLASDAYNMALGEYARDMHNTFREQHAWCRQTMAQEKPGRMPPRADARLMAIVLKATEMQWNHVPAMCKAGEELKAELLASPSLREDLAVTTAVESCKGVRARARVLAKAGFETPPLPELNEQEIELHVRNVLRRARPAKVEPCLPSSWSQAYAGVWNLPLNLLNEATTVDEDTYTENRENGQNCNEEQEITAVLNPISEDVSREEEERSVPEFSESVAPADVSRCREPSGTGSTWGTSERWSDGFPRRANEQVPVADVADAALGRARLARPTVEQVPAVGVEDAAFSRARLARLPRRRNRRRSRGRMGIG